MNISPNAQTILCFGDSNTHGQIPATYQRYPIDLRWTGILQQLLGSDYRIIEEGLGGRTVNQDDGNRADRNGYSYFVPCLSSHQPIDQVIIMLGTNDTKAKFDLSPEKIADGLRPYIEHAFKYEAEVLLVSPIILNPQASEWTFYGKGHFDEGSARKSEQLVDLIKQLAGETDARYFAASSVVSPGIDGIHMDEAAHRLFAEALARIVRK